jgi:hypothetical protein
LQAYAWTDPQAVASEGGDALAAVTHAAATVVEGASWASVTRGVGLDYRTLAWSGSPARAADRLQARIGAGPALDDVVDSWTFHAGDLASDHRWADFGPRAVSEIGTRSVLSVRLASDGRRGHDDHTALNVYADHPYAFTGASILTTTLLAVRVAGALDAAAVEAPDRVAVATGVVMRTYDVSRTEAVALLRLAAQLSHRTVVAAGAEVAETGVLGLPTSVR